MMKGYSLLFAIMLVAALFVWAAPPTAGQ